MRRAGRSSWTGDRWRRVVAVAARRSASSRSGRSSGCWSTDAIVICAGGGGIPTMYRALDGATDSIGRASRRSSTRISASELLAEDLSAPTCFVMATDADAVYAGLGNAAAAARSRRYPRTSSARSRSPPVRWDPRSARRSSFVRSGPGSRAAIGARSGEIECDRRRGGGDAGGQVVTRQGSERRRDGERSGRTRRSGSCARRRCTGPELSLQRLTPSNHDELLFDDVALGGARPVTSTTSSSRRCASAASRCLPAPRPARRGARRERRRRRRRD